MVSGHVHLDTIRTTLWIRNNPTATHVRTLIRFAAPLKSAYPTQMLRTQKITVWTALICRTLAPTPGSDSGVGLHAPVGQRNDAGREMRHPNPYTKSYRGGEAPQ